MAQLRHQLSCFTVSGLVWCRWSSAHGAAEALLKRLIASRFRKHCSDLQAAFKQLEQRAWRS
jgi:hypothetical protein